MWFWWFLFVCNLFIPAVMVIFGYVMWKYPPKDINRVYGYRTARSMKNIHTWQFAQVYCGRLWWKLGWILGVLTILIQVLFLHRSANMLGIGALVIVLVQLVVMLLTILPTEMALQKKFDEHGNVR